MKTAIVGCGNVSRMHFNAINDISDVEITAVADIKPERADAMAAEYGAKAYYDFDELIENEKLDAIHICTPHYLHTPMAIKALKKGINVLLEKPCSVSLEEIEELRKAEAESGKQLGICFQNRYNGCVREAKKIIDSGEMGKVRSVRAFVTWERGEDYYSDDWHGTLGKECGGVLINQSIHTMDLVQYLGGRCKKVTAHVSNDHLKGIIEVEDTASALLELENGATAIFYATLAYGENSDVFIEISLDNGRIRIEGEKLFIIGKDGKTAEIPLENNNVYHGQRYWGSGHSVLIEDYYYCLRTGEKFEIDAVEGGRAAQIVACCYISSETNESVTID